MQLRLHNGVKQYTSTSKTICTVYLQWWGAVRCVGETSTDFYITSRIQARIQNRIRKSVADPTRSGSTTLAVIIGRISTFRASCLRDLKHWHHLFSFFYGMFYASNVVCSTVRLVPFITVTTN